MARQRITVTIPDEREPLRYEWRWTVGDDEIHKVSTDQDFEGHVVWTVPFTDKDRETPGLFDAFRTAIEDLNHDHG